MRRLVFVAVLLFAVGANAAEKWYEAYARGVQAVNTKNYSVAAEALQRSISEMPNEDKSARTRRDNIVYVPHFWLGIAKINLGDIDGALREFKTSEDQGVIQNTDYYARMREWVARAQAEKQKSAQQAVAEPKKAADAAVSRAMSMQMDALAAGADRSDAYRSGQRKLQEAIDQFNKAGTDARAFHRAGETAAQARDLFASAAEEAKRAKAARPASPAPQRPAPVPQKPAAPPVEVARVQTETVAQQKPVETPKPQPSVEKPQPAAPQADVEDEALVGARVALQDFRRRLISAASQRRNDGKYQQVVRDASREAATLDQQLQKKQDAATIARTVEFVKSRGAELDALTSAAPAATVTATGSVQTASSATSFEAAYRAYARGDLDGSDQMLTQLLSSTPTAEGYMLRGCTRYTKAMMSRDPRSGLASAASDFKSAIKLNRKVRLEKAAFSPKLVEYFDSVRTGVVR